MWRTAARPRLPFGLQKRLDLARAMAEEPRLLVLDEPFGRPGRRRTGAADQPHIRQLQARGTAVVVIDHVLDDLFSVAHRVLAFDFGRTADGRGHTGHRAGGSRGAFVVPGYGRSRRNCPSGSASGR